MAIPTAEKRVEPDGGRSYQGWYIKNDFRVRLMGVMQVCRVAVATHLVTLLFVDAPMSPTSAR